MKFREATDSLCSKLDHRDIARALSVSLQTIRQARLEPENAAHREAPADWEDPLIRLAEERIEHYRKLIDAIRKRGDRAERRLSGKRKGRH